MKPYLMLLVSSVIAMTWLTSCAPAPVEWANTPDPLDDVITTTPRVNWHPESAGRFGPFGAMWGRTY